ncbi:IS30 family transposase [Coxiella burnetii]|uniref:IS30 family transposase n=1 Tax=Coxiella burnetii TaxID=777 RepID=UPI000589C7F7|nr:IS30 family transposase [Coxiella burnetii]
MKEKRSFSHLSLYEREQLFVYKQQGKCLREIGRLLDRDHSVISRELKRNSNPHDSVLKTKSYFCKPYHSWEKGAIENTNGLIRRFIPKKTDLANFSQEQLDQIEYLLNHRPRKCLGFKTPYQVFLKRTGAIPP